MRPLLLAFMFAASATAAGAQAPTVTLLGYHTQVPPAWSARAAASTMRLAEYTAQGGAEVVVYFFGRTQGGTVEANTERWKAQFSNPDGSPVREKIVRDSSGAFAVTYAEYHGSYARGIGAGVPVDQAKPGQQLVAAIVETPHGTMYIQLFGPDAAVGAQRDALVAFVRGLRE